MTTLDNRTAALNVDDRIRALEDKAYRLGQSGSCPGTSISRVLPDSRILEKLGATPTSRVWCLAMGGMSQPKEFFYSLRLEDVIKQAEDWLAAL